MTVKMWFFLMTCEPQKNHMREPEANDTTGRGGAGQSAEDGNTAARAEDQTCSVPLQSASCKNPSYGENTFKHTLFSSLHNINWVRRFSASVVWVNLRLAYCPTFCETKQKALCDYPKRCYIEYRPWCVDSIQ